MSLTAPTVSRPATDKQIAFLTKLVKQTKMECEIGEELTTKEASALIDRALELATEQKAAKAGTPTPAPITSGVEGLSIVELLELALEKARQIGV